ncbi:serine/threonine-protein kinase 16 isoform X1 [Myzus persicae]|uniref:serine/threonine-protein kinase 16 isoform X1 n=2 Tax=Myzus persicae TaxID=13164 RepID=UPI000B932A2F|nr:serine/threonine-protein kinase 16 isoform X1 [Myzus persicae]
MGCACEKQHVTIQDNKYYVHDQIGQGGFSSVFLVKDTDNMKFVLKCILCHDQKDREKAWNEAKVHQLLQSSGNKYVLNLIGCGMIEKSLEFSKTPTDTFLMLLPYYKNGSLHDNLIKPHYHMDLKYVLKHFRSICLSVKTFHDLSYSHRDIKPANILFNDNNEPVIIDLGSAAPAKITVTSKKEAQELLDDVNERCSMTYRAPELFNIDINSVIDERIDVWSLGCLLYAMLYKKSPFDLVYERGDSVALAVISGKIYFPPNSNESVNNLVKVMLTVDHFKRPFIDDVLESVKVVDELFDQDFNEHTILNSNICNV